MSELDTRSIEKETLATEDAAISRLLKRLERVSAPADFDVRLRARIARRRESPAAGRRFPVFARYAAGLCAILVVAGLVGYVWLSRPGVSVNPTVASNGPAFERRQIDQVSNSIQATPARPVDDRAAVVSSVPPNSARPVVKDADKASVPAVTATDVPGTSLTEARREGKRVLPKGIRLNAEPLAKPKDFDSAPQRPASEVLTLLGIDAKFANGAWRVDSVKELTTAGRVGVKTGDVIEALNDQPLGEKASFGKAFSIKSLRVKRNGQSVNISLIEK